MPRQRLNLRQLTETALALVDQGGFDSLNLSNVADGLGVGPSALYTHVDGLDGLRCLVAVQSTNNLTDAVRNAAIGVSGPAAVQAMGNAYRRFAIEFPGRFASTVRPPSGSDDELAAANADLLEVFALVYRGAGLGSAEAVLAAGSTRSALHGFVVLELASGSTAGHDRQYGHLLETLTRALTR